MLSVASASRIDPAALPMRWWRELELWCVVALVLAIYVPRLTVLTVRGEESRWARVAQEMREGHDWIVPRQQGQPFADRPPMGSWAILAASMLVGEVSKVAIRLPSVLAVLATSVLLYGYCRQFLSITGAVAAAVAYPTMSQVLQLGRLGENDALLALAVSGSLLAWHGAYCFRRDPRLAWTSGYLLAAVAALVKGPQGPIYFVAGVTVYLVLERDWRFLFSRWHLAGALLAVATIAAWQVPFTLAVGSQTAQAVWLEGGDFSQRLAYGSLASTMRHWAMYPFELFACMLPWSFMLPPLTSRWLRSKLAGAAPVVGFLVTVCLVALPTCWLPAETRPRYFMPMYPCIAVLCGVAIARTAAAIEQGWWPQSWNRFLRAACLLICAASVCVVAAPWLPVALVASVSGRSIVLVVVSGAAALVLIRWAGREPRWAWAGVWACAGFWGLFTSAVVIDAQRAVSNDPAGEIARVRALVPTGETLTSFRPIHHLFAFHYRDAIGAQMVEHDRAPADFAGTYFCFGVAHDTPPVEMPFAWEEVTQVSCERLRSPQPRTKVIVGRRLSPARPTEPSSELAEHGR